jgi:Zn-dependent protease
MLPDRKGALRLFRAAGIDVYLHWSWFLLAAWRVSNRIGDYTSIFWPILEYLTLFVIVLMHEFGHSLACKQVGGQANQIVLWPLGGIAYVNPPQRPGATLWSIAAGPLVNVALFPIFCAAWFFAHIAGWEAHFPNAYQFLRALWFIDLALLVFNLLPIYPLDGGQILRSLLWYIFGRARSLMIAAVIGLVGVAAVAVAALVTREWWLVVMAVFILLNCWSGLQHARELSRVAAAPARPGLACPACATAPPAGAFWICGRCKNRFDIFAGGGMCPNCQAQYLQTRCLECSRLSPLQSFQLAGRV